MIKMVFKWLIGTLVVIGGSFAIIEFVNVTMASHMVTQTLDRSIELACDYFSQETYKNGSIGARGNLPNVVGSQGGNVSGLFYIGGDADTVHRNLYTDSSSFNSFVDKFSGTWQALEDVRSGDSALMEDNLITPANMGVTYLDEPTIERIASWNIAKILSGGNMDNVKGSGDGTYVRYSGYDVFVNQLKITNIKYRVVNMGSSEFKKITHMNASDLGVDMSDKERANICVADVEFSVPIRYTGITPIKNVINLLSDDDNYRVVGMNDTMTPSQGLYNRYNTSTENYEAGGSGSNSKPTTGNITYYIIR